MKRYFCFLVVLLLGTAFTLAYADRIDAWDPYTPAPGAFDGLTQREIENKERELEATKAIDREYQEVSRGGDRVLNMEATAYCYTGNQTFTGTWPAEGRTVAVDPEVIPLNSKLIINGQGGYIAEDTGSAIQKNKIDIYMNGEQRCLEWGRQQVQVKVIE